MTLFEIAHESKALRGLMLKDRFGFTTDLLRKAVSLLKKEARNAHFYSEFVTPNRFHYYAQLEKILDEKTVLTLMASGSWDFVVETFVGHCLNDNLRRSSAFDGIIGCGLDLYADFREYGEEE